MNKLFSRIRIFLWLKIKEIIPVILIVGLVFITGYLYVNYVEKGMNSTNVWKVFWSIYPSIISICLGTFFILFILVSSFIEWIKDNWRQAGVILEHKS